MGNIIKFEGAAPPHPPSNELIKRIDGYLRRTGNLPDTEEKRQQSAKHIDDTISKIKTFAKWQKFPKSPPHTAPDGVPVTFKNSVNFMVPTNSEDELPETSDVSIRYVEIYLGTVESRPEVLYLSCSLTDSYWGGEDLSRVTRQQHVSFISGTVLNKDALIASICFNLANLPIVDSDKHTTMIKAVTLVNSSIPT